jgi:hypothetical protein
MLIMKSVYQVALAAIFSLSVTTISAQTQISETSLKQGTTELQSPLSQLLQLKPVSFRYNTGITGLRMPEGTQYGFLASDVKSVLPGLVKSEGKFVPAGKNAFRTVAVDQVDMQSLIPFLVGALREQQQEIEQLKAEVSKLKGAQ